MKGLVGALHEEPGENKRGHCDLRQEQTAVCFFGVFFCSLRVTKKYAPLHQPEGTCAERSWTRSKTSHCILNLLIPRVIPPATNQS